MPIQAPEITGALLTYIRRRMWYRFRRSVNQGVGLFLVASIAFVVAGVVGRELVSDSDTSSKWMSDYFKSPQLGPDDGKAASLFAIVASSISGNLKLPSIGCPDNAADCIRGERLLKRTQAAASVLGRPIVLASDLRLAMDQIGDHAAAGSSEVFERAAKRANLISIAAIPPKPSDMDCEDLANDWIAAERRRMFSLSRATCVIEPELRTKVIVPEQMTNSSGEIDFRKRLAMRVSESIELALATEDWSSVADANQNTNAYKLVQAYFVSTDSVLRIWQAGADPTQLNLSRNRLWASRPYFMFYFDRPNAAPRSYTSPPYLDLGGNGLVQTRCQQIVTTIRSKERLIIGIACFDLALTEHAIEEQFLKGLEQSPWVDAHLVSIKPSGVDRKFENSSDKPAQYSRLLQELDSDAARVWQQTAKAEVGDIKVGDDAWVLVPLTDQGSHRLLISVKPSSESVGAFGTRGLFGLLLGLAGALITFAAWQSRSISSFEERLAILRTLPDAAIETDRTDQIIGANDCAEELFGIPFKKFGLMGGSKPSFWSIFDGGNMRCCSPNEGAPPSAQSSQVVPLTKEAIEVVRRRGRTSTYYAKCFLDSQWYRIEGGPILSPSTTRLTNWFRAEVQSTFAVIGRVGDAVDIERLESSLK